MGATGTHIPANNVRLRDRSVRRSPSKKQKKEGKILSKFNPAHFYYCIIRHPQNRKKVIQYCIKIQCKYLKAKERKNNGRGL
jgi:hypothetical protein